MQMDSVLIVSIARTPQGKLLGALKDVTGTELGATAIKAAVQRAKLAATDIDEILMGCVLPAGLGQAPARQAALKAGLPTHTNCTTINKVCGSGMKAVMLAHAMILSQPDSIIVAGGMESMTNAPYLLKKARQGYRLGHGDLFDHMQLDGLEDAYEPGRLMGTFAENCAAEFHFSRQDQDDYATASLMRAQKAIQDKSFHFEMVPVTIQNRQGEITVDTDEHPGSVKLEKIPLLPPAFSPDGTITAASSAAIADGAAAVVLMHSTEVEKRGLSALARIIGYSSHAKSPDQFTTAPIDAIKKLLKKVSWKIAEVDLFEVNEAFAVVPMVVMKELNIPHEKINIFGSGCALGHPIGATGTRIIVTLISALKSRGLKKGIASLCIGGGEATAIAIEML